MQKPNFYVLSFISIRFARSFVRFDAVVVTPWLWQQVQVVQQLQHPTTPARHLHSWPGSLGLAWGSCLAEKKGSFCLRHWQTLGWQLMQHVDQA